MRNQIIAAALGAAVCLLVAALVLDGPGVGPQVVIFGIVGGMIGWLAVKIA